MESNCHACKVISGDLGMKKRTAMPMAREMIKRMGLAPCKGEGGGFFDSVCVGGGGIRGGGADDDGFRGLGDGVEEGESGGVWDEREFVHSGDDGESFEVAAEMAEEMGRRRERERRENTM
ncbi:hypothetical protein OROHE_012183 [Orobanche hederae]